MYFLFVLIFVSNFSFACFVPPSDWSWSEQELVYCTKKIFVGTYDGEAFTIKESIKGDAKIGSKVKSSIPNTNNASTLVGIQPDCTPHTGFKKNETYVVFLNAVGEKAYTDVKDKNSKSWIERVKKLSKNSNFKSSCLVQGQPKK